MFHARNSEINEKRIQSRVLLNSLYNTRTRRHLTSPQWRLTTYYLQNLMAEILREEMAAFMTDTDLSSSSFLEALILSPGFWLSAVSPPPVSVICCSYPDWSKLSVPAGASWNCWSPFVVSYSAMMCVNLQAASRERTTSTCGGLCWSRGVPHYC